ncbi:PD-(D/E)XK nuclease family protein [Bacteroides salyersiae]|nr:PD-(D/E)XK nuclease family protein [Bacteroides salyersiae]
MLRDDVRIQGYVDRAFKEEFFHVPLDERPEYNGVQLINSKVISSYLRRLLRNDLAYAPFSMAGMEEPVEEPLEVNTPEGTIKIKIGGTIDRMDCKEDTLRIVDYKTGGSPKTPANIEQLFIPAEGRPNYIFQTFPYAAIMSRKQSLKVAPALLYIHRAANESYSPVIEIGEPRKPKIPVNNFAFFEDEFRERLQRLLGRNIRSGNTLYTNRKHESLRILRLPCFMQKMKKCSYFPISPILKEITASPFCNLPINIVVEKAERGTVSVVSERIWLYTSTPDKL